MAVIRKAVNKVLKSETHKDVLESLESSLELAMTLLKREMSEDRLAGILVIAEHILPSGKLDAQANWKTALAHFGTLYDDHLIDWNTNDWFSTKVLSNLVQRIPEKREFAHCLLEWKASDSVWMRRASHVGFVMIAKQGDRW
eukprot:CAMPEP_0204825022 /NCGR_PEP_ID=MMETSP1346-20131115/3001_1 /ASSEMBLY_ACC=CAM_ASM_000771 /TAXON_ID=215587 /ORGANISM="Aplanochytrium stocchinoi, Strain GSBS06" /LENGTH=141 /DNA_ID=CAMNT_0051952505 /DNA_START=266 /DNA_END=688 /DNA_ORIENTATION=-